MKEEFKKAVAFYDKGKLDEAKNICLKIFNHIPDHFDNLRLLNFIFFKKKKYSLAIDFINKAIKINPKFAENYNEKGVAFTELKKHQSAIECFDKAININPKYFDALYNKGVVLHELRKLEEAIENYDKALIINSNHVLALNNKGFALQQLKKFDSSLESYYKAFKINPNFDFLLGKIIHTKSLFCNWKFFDENLKNLKNKLNKNEASSLPFATLSLYDSPLLQKKTTETWIKKTYSNINKLKSISKHKPNKKIRLGYYSADFHNHATSHLIAYMFELHDKSKFELFGFSFGPDKNDEMRKRISSSFDHFVDVRLKSDVDIVKLSRNFKIDIAIDLKGITTDARFGIFINRCAPIQISYLGFPGTSGTDLIDYIIAHKTLIPKENQKFFSEKIIYLPDSYQPNDYTKKMSKKVFTREELSLPKNAFVFCCFNQNYKITPNIFNIWMKILKKIEGSVLWLIKDSNEGVNNLKKEANKRGINPDKIIFAKRMTISEHLARHKMADLFIDTFPYTAHTTCSDALWSGLPVITLMGQSFASRLSGTLLNAVGLNELIATTEKDYEDLIINLAKDSNQLKIIKNKLEKNKINQPIFNTKLYTKKIESAYKEIYKRYHSDLPLENIEIE
jgi:predicted O-linked N-acetylglucosamine transferase (SPINDLY family)